MFGYLYLFKAFGPKKPRNNKENINFCKITKPCVQVQVEQLPSLKNKNEEGIVLKSILKILT